MATNPAARQLMKGKRPLWMTTLLVVGAILIWYAQQKGWIGRSASSPNAGPVATIPEPSTSSTRSAPASPSAAIDDDSSENDASLTAAERASKPAVDTSSIDDLFKKNRDLIWVEGALTVSKLLRDDDDPPRHQRFIAETPDGHEVMVAHNIDLSDRVPAKEGDTIEVRGEYVWTDQGGKVHFTHKPQYGKFQGGWIDHRGTRYE
ncbi:MAG TPA: DUF3465 domain-containing protein [Phycisphaerales bacterium]|nr:DUF3465 domain-containing protein [Phycisphaerales bacterium]